MSSTELLYLAVVLVSILISMTLHEAMHAYTSYWLGDDTAKSEGRLTLNPLAHIDPFMTVLMPLILVVLGAPPFGAAKPVPFDPRKVRFGEFGAALVGLAGPLTNLVLALAAGLAVRVFGADMGVLMLNVLLTFMMVNISFFVFNMIPFPPLDGSRVMYAIAPDFVREAMERVERIGVMALIFFMFIFYAFLSEPFIQVIRYLIGLFSGYSVM